MIVGFLNDDPNDPVILGMLNSSALPAPLEPEEPNNEKGFVTREQIKLIFNDEKKSVIIETPGGKKITLDDDAGEVKVEDENGNSALLNSDGITVESAGDINMKATGDVNIEGTNVSITASAEFKAEGSAGSELASPAITKVSGSLVQIN